MKMRKRNVKIGREGARAMLYDTGKGKRETLVYDE